MSSVDEQKFQEAFPAIQEDDPFAGFCNNHTTMDFTDPFAPASSESDPFAAIERKTAAENANPFLDSEFSILGDVCPAPSNATSGSATPIDDQQSVQSTENAWPGNNTVESLQEISHDSAVGAVNSSSEAPEHALAPDRSTDPDSSESSASSGRAIPNIAIDSDSGNLTADINVNVPAPNAVYEILEQTTREQRIPTVVLTEATLNSEKSSCFDAQADSSLTSEEGRARLLETTDTESSRDISHSNVASISSNDCGALVHADNLSTMNISLLNNEAAGQLECSQDMEPSEAHNFFVQSVSSQESGEQGGKDDAGVETYPPEERPSGEVESESLLKSKSSRVFTSSPINIRTVSPESEPVSDPLTVWKQDFKQRLATKDEKEQKDISELREQAKRDLERWYCDRKTRIEAQHSIHMDDQEYLYTEREDTDNIWQRMSRLALELQQSQKVDEKKKDTSKMKHLLQFLALKVPAPNEQFRTRS